MEKRRGSTSSRSYGRLPERNTRHQQWGFGLKARAALMTSLCHPLRGCEIPHKRKDAVLDTDGWYFKGKLALEAGVSMPLLK
jgi:hypothetical protein